MSRPSLGIALMITLAVLVLLVTNVAANLAALPLIGVPVGTIEGASILSPTGSGDLPQPPASDPAAQGEVLSSLIVLGLLFGFAVWRIRRIAPREQGKPFGFIFVATIVGLFMTIMIFGRAIADLLIATTAPRGGSAAYLDPSLVVYATSALGVSIIAVSALFSARAWRRRGGTTADPGQAIAKEFSNVLDGTVYSLRAGSDYRLAVLNCYKALCGVLQEGGAANSPELTAREFEAMATARLSLRTGYLHRITELFEKARYSSDDVDGEDARSAEESLVALGRELRSRGASPAESGVHLP